MSIRARNIAILIAALRRLIRPAVITVPALTAKPIALTPTPNASLPLMINLRRNCHEFPFYTQPVSV